MDFVHRSILTAMTAVMFLPAASAQQPTATPDGAQFYDVAIRKIMEKRDSADDVLKTELIDRRARMAEKFSASLLELHERLVDLRENPKDSARRAAYENALSKMLVQTNDELAEWLKSKPAILAAINGFKQIIEDAVAQGNRDLTVCRKEEAMFAAKAEELSTALRKIALNSAELIEKNQPLPPALELDIRLMDADWKAAERAKKLAENAAKRLQNELDHCQKDIARLTTVHDRLVVNFRECEGHRMLLAKVAEMKSLGLAARQLRQRCGEIINSIGGLSTSNQSVSELIDVVIDHDVSEEISADTQSDNSIVAPATSSAADILKFHSAVKQDPSP